MKKNRTILIATSLLWLLMIAAGVGLLWSYEGTPGVAAAALDRWPADSRLRHSADRATLVMLAHPHCPCTRASLAELNRLMARARGRATAYVLFVKPSGSPDGWEKTDLLTSAASIPGVTVVRDDAGVEAARFRAATSGQTMLYDAGGRLLFSGGITSARGHEGDNAGRSAVVSLLDAVDAGQTVSAAVDAAQGATPVVNAGQGATPVFGCPLFAPGGECLTGKEAGREKHDH
jgi:hypothetical protein